MDRPIYFWLIGQLPGGKNAVRNTRSGRRYPGARFKKWLADAATQLLLQGVPKKRLARPLRIDVVYVKGDWKERDLPGMKDALLHLAEKYGIVDKDKWFEEDSWERGDPGLLDGQPGVRVWITPIEEVLPSHRRPRPRSRSR